MHPAGDAPSLFLYPEKADGTGTVSYTHLYYYGFRSLRALLKSYVGGLLCEKSLCYSAKNARAKYWFSQNPRRVTCCVTMRCTGFFPPCFPKGGMKL